jgi:heme exporter protein A
VIRLAGVWKRYGRRPALRDIDLELTAGARLVLRGANGSGKSTLLKIIGGLALPDRGQVERRTRRVAYLGHHAQLLPSLTVRENLRYQAGLYGLAQGALETGMARFGVAHFADLPVRALSRGMQQRVSLARVAALDADLWLLDEADTGLDVEGRDLLATLLLEATAAGKTLVASVHAPLAGLDGDRELTLSEGRIV